MKKLMYIQPSVEVTELMMTHTLCQSPGGGGTSLGGINPPNVTTDEQL